MLGLVIPPHLQKFFLGHQPVVFTKQVRIMPKNGIHPLSFLGAEFVINKGFDV